MEPYAYRWDRSHYTSELQAEYAGLGDGAEADGAPRVSVAGRVMAKRVMGKLAFLSLRDDKGTVQVGRLDSVHAAACAVLCSRFGQPASQPQACTAHDVALHAAFGCGLQRRT